MCSSSPSLVELSMGMSVTVLALQLKLLDSMGVASDIQL